MGTISLADSRDVLDNITATQAKRISGLYGTTLTTVQKRIKQLSKDNTATGALQLTRLKALEKELNKNITAVSSKLGGIITDNMGTVAGAVVKDNLGWAVKMGLEAKGMLASVPQDVVMSITYGKVYDDKWNLSKAIWSHDSSVKRDIHDVIARGVAQNKSAFDIGKDLEKYVDPKQAKDWAWNKVYPGTASRIDYNAQRLSRTMVTHAYEQSLVRSVKDNPFVTGIEWQSGHSDRVCPICQDRDGVIYAKDQLPMDHPNGMCTWIPVIPENDDAIIDRIANWHEEGNDAELDKFAGRVGYQGGETGKQMKAKLTRTGSPNGPNVPSAAKAPPAPRAKALPDQPIVGSADNVDDLANKKLYFTSDKKPLTYNDVTKYDDATKNYLLRVYQENLGITSEQLRNMTSGELDDAVKRMFSTLGKSSADDAMGAIKKIRTSISNYDGSANYWKEVSLDDVNKFTDRQKNDFIMRSLNENKVNFDYKALKLMDKDEFIKGIFSETMDKKSMQALTRELNAEFKKVVDAKTAEVVKGIKIDNTIATSKLKGKAGNFAVEEIDDMYSTLPNNLRKLEAINSSDKEYRLLKTIDIKGDGFYNSNEKLLSFNLNADMKTTVGMVPSPKYHTYFHEYGHYLDDLSGNISGRYEFLEAIKKDYEAIEKKFTLAELKSKLGGINTEMTRGIQDTISGMSQNKLRISYGHTTAYWNGKGPLGVLDKVGSETFAGITSAHTNATAMKFYNDYFPSVVKAYGEVIDDALFKRAKMEVLSAW